MKELAGRLTALDPDAGAAVRVIAYFDRLAESRAGVEALVRGAAVLAGCPARLVDPERRVHVRVEPDGTRRDAELPPDPAWPSARLAPDGAAALWLERDGFAPGSSDKASAGAVPGTVDAVRLTRAATGKGGITPAPATPRAGASERLAGAAPGTSDSSPATALPSVVDAVILERAAGALRVVLDRTRGRVPADDPALIETLLDGTAPEQARLHAARRLGLDPAVPARALAPLDGRPRVVVADAESLPAGDGATPARASDPERPASARAASHPRTGTSAGTGTAPGSAASDARRFSAGRLGVGPAVPVLELPRSWDAARTALRFTAEGTPQDPGPRVVYAEELGGIALLADLVAPGAEPPPDVRALEAAATHTPWLLSTLHAVASTASLRAAATGVNVHHSTLQDRLAHAEHLLGWPLRTPQGRLRLQLALTMRHLARR
ncbi:helix-turn-helix domain-containing protein [Streptomyces olindensis]|uniref:helix-turn-helix domain-containing protein n=1 Tax=Streptomyces olindensis TaxID=358823 RepID=UPI0036674CD5